MGVKVRGHEEDRVFAYIYVSYLGGVCFGGVSCALNPGGGVCEHKQMFRIISSGLRYVGSLMLSEVFRNQIQTWHVDAVAT